MTSYTEEEAKSKWCPFARGAVGLDRTTIVGNRFVEGDLGDIARAHMTCLGSGCMAWTQDFKTIYRAPVKVGSVTDLPELEFEPTGKGYCGLVARGDRS